MARFGQPLYPGGLNAQIQSALRVLVPEQGACCWKFARRGESTHNCGLCSAPVKILERRHELIESLRISHVEPLSNESYRLFSLTVPGVLFRISSLHVLDKKKEKPWPSRQSCSSRTRSSLWESWRLQPALWHPSRLTSPAWALLRVAHISTLHIRRCMTLHLTDTPP